MNYSVDNGRPIDYYFYEPDPGLQLNPPGTAVQEVVVHDAWGEVDQLSVDREGFELHDFGAQFTQFNNEEMIRKVFYQQVISYVKLHTGAKQVVIFDHTVRKRMPADL